MGENKITKSLSTLVAKRTITNIETKTETNKPKLILEGFLIGSCHFLLRNTRIVSSWQGYILY